MKANSNNANESRRIRRFGKGPKAAGFSSIYTASPAFEEDIEKRPRVFDDFEPYKVIGILAVRKLFDH